ncbi:hypothetical protein ACFVWY_05570 [Streptomyces sp. NPDC058195]|uniref:hypothetical protein n=1 Tax=Streptomyces sp. NPDC058195 TaxID=3346375 RepID=UPI0036EB450E
MEAELAALATTGATALVGLMVSDAWAQARQRVAGFLARGGDTDGVDEELEASRAELVAAQDGTEPGIAADIEEEWRLRLRRALRADPSAAGDLRHLLDEIAPGGGPAPTLTVHNTVSGGTQHAPVFQGAHQNLTGAIFNQYGSRAPEPGPGAV